MEIHEWLMLHDAISLNWIEKKVGITTGTLRKGKVIPEKYVTQIGLLLNDYGYKDTCEGDSNDKREVIVKSKTVVNVPDVVHNEKKVTAKHDTPNVNSERLQKAKEALEGVADETQKERNVIFNGPGVIIDDTNKHETVYVTDENVRKDADGIPMGFFVTFVPDYKFDGRKCSYQNRKGEKKLVLITDEMVALGSREDCVQSMFKRFNDPYTFQIVVKYLEDHPEERVEEEKEAKGVISSSIIPAGEKKDEFDSNKF